MKINYSLALVSILAIAVSACGGGGGDGGDARNVSGLWRGSLIKVSDTCNPAGPASIGVSHQVNQNEDAINLLAESGVTFLGNTVGEDGFSVDGSHTTVGSAQCSDQSRIEYNNINDDDDVAADIVITINRTCSGGAACTLQYSGTVSRTVNPAAVPPGVIATPTITTASSGGCSEINPNTVAGSFSGDGSCGVSATNFSYQNNVVVLEPFGANGLTSFNVDPTNPALAASQRTDLTILNEAGNACYVICSPPSTFSVKCLKEGGTSCIEKF